MSLVSPLCRTLLWNRVQNSKNASATHLASRLHLVGGTRQARYRPSMLRVCLVRLIGGWQIFAKARAFFSPLPRKSASGVAPSHSGFYQLVTTLANTSRWVTLFGAASRRVRLAGELLIFPFTPLNTLARSHCRNFLTFLRVRCLLIRPRIKECLILQ